MSLRKPTGLKLLTANKPGQGFFPRVIRDAALDIEWSDVRVWFYGDPRGPVIIKTFSSFENRLGPGWTQWDFNYEVQDRTLGAPTLQTWKKGTVWVQDWTRDDHSEWELAGEFSIDQWREWVSEPEPLRKALVTGYKAGVVSEVTIGNGSATFDEKRTVQIPGAYAMDWIGPGIAGVTSYEHTTDLVTLDTRTFQAVVAFTDERLRNGIGLHVAGAGVAFVGSQKSSNVGGVLALNVTNPFKFTAIGDSSNIPGDIISGPYSMASHATELYLCADTSRFLCTIDLEDPASMFLRRHWHCEEIGEGQNRIMLDWPLAFVTTDIGVIFLYDLSHPCDPRLIATAYHPDAKSIVWAQKYGQRIYALTDYGKVCLFQIGFSLATGTVEMPFQRSVQLPDRPDDCLLYGSHLYVTCRGPEDDIPGGSLSIVHPDLLFVENTVPNPNLWGGGTFLR